MSPAACHAVAWRRGLGVLAELRKVDRPNPTAMVSDGDEKDSDATWPTRERTIYIYLQYTYTIYLCTYNLALSIYMLDTIACGPT